MIATTETAILARLAAQLVAGSVPHGARCTYRPPSRIACAHAPLRQIFVAGSGRDP